MSEHIDPLITSAANDGTDEQYSALFAALAGAELFASLSAGWTPGNPVQLGTNSVGPLKKVLRFFTNRQHPNLTAPYAGMRWEAIVNMILNSADLEGVQIVNRADDWVAFSRGELVAAQQSPSPDVP